MRFIGDCHSRWSDYAKAVGDAPASIQVGDMGIGFDDEGARFRPTDQFIRGNHDDPAKCREHPNWIADGHIHMRGKHVFMYIGGARSRDRRDRQEYDREHGTVSWWPNEELSESEFEIMQGIYALCRPTIMVTHDCPTSVDEALFDRGRRTDYPSATQQALEKMLKHHTPDYWIFGHHHESKRQVINGTRFICLAPLEVYDLDT